MIISQFPQRRTKNLLINAGFRVNQRGYVSGTATAAADEYTIDRWRVLVSGEFVTFPVLGADNTITVPAGGMGQKIGGFNIKGGVYTVNWQGSATCKVNGVVRKTGESFVLDADTLVDVVFYGGIVNKPQIEEGSIQTSFEYRHFSTERTLSENYYSKSPVEGERVIVSQYNGLYVRSQKIVFPQKMRVVPTVVLEMIDKVGATGVQGALYLVLASEEGVSPTWNWTSGTLGRDFVASVTYEADAEL